MGSTGSGSFSDYSGQKPTSPNANNGGTSGEDNCNIAFSTSLEEVSRCFYFINYAGVPPVDTEVSVRFNGVRLVIETDMGEVIGYLPTKYNYLRTCLNNGFNYKGAVSFSTTTPSPVVRVDIVPA